MDTNWIFAAALTFAVVIFSLIVRSTSHTEIEQRKTKGKNDECVKPGYYWYEDDTFSKKRIPDKKIKAIVELVEDGFIYGNLTISELLTIKEQQLTYDEAKRFFEGFSYPCKENEKIVWYDIHQLVKAIRKAPPKCYPSVRCYWSCSECISLQENAYIFDCKYNDTFDTPKNNKHYIRPIIAMKCDATLLDIVNF